MVKYIVKYRRPYVKAFITDGPMYEYVIPEGGGGIKGMAFRSLQAAVDAGYEFLIQNPGATNADSVSIYKVEWNQKAHAWHELGFVRSVNI